MLLKFFLAVYANNRGIALDPGDAEKYYQICIDEGKDIDLLGRIVALAINKSME